MTVLRYKLSFFRGFFGLRPPQVPRIATEDRRQPEGELPARLDLAGQNFVQVVAVAEDTIRHHARSKPTGPHDGA